MAEPSNLGTRQPSTPLERGLYLVYRTSSVGIAWALVAFVAYLVGGFGLHATNLYTPTYRVMSLSDPLFLAVSLFVGLSICLLSGSLFSLTLLVSARDERTEFVVLMSLIAFGFGAAVVRIVVESVWGVIV